MSYSVIRSHEICAGHRVVGHESKCRHLHGHNYVFHFKVAPKKNKVTVNPTPIEGTTNLYGVIGVKDLDTVGRVIDFSVVKSTLCEWLENNWDHKFLHYTEDKLIAGLIVANNCYDGLSTKDHEDFMDSLVALTFNPTAENLAAHMVNVIGPELLDEHGVELVSCVIEETSKCHVEYTK